MASLQARLLDAGLRLSQVRNIGNRILPYVYRYISTDAKPPARLRAQHRLTERSAAGRTVYEIAPKHAPGRPHVFYLHGGAHFNGFISVQWNFLDRLTAAAGCRVTAPDYPLAPCHSCGDMMAMILPLYREILAGTDPSDVVLVGDSSGGGLVLALLQILRDGGLPQPRRAVLIAPWLDVTMSNPEIARMQADDPFLGLRECIYAGKRYAGADDPRSTPISPIYGRMEGLCPISLFIGTRDLMLPDCRKLKEIFEGIGKPLDYREYAGMIHDWIMLSLPESYAALGELVAILARGD